MSLAKMDIKGSEYLGFQASKKYLRTYSREMADSFIVFGVWFLIFCFFSTLFLCCVYIHYCAMKQVWKSEDNCVGVISLLVPCGFRGLNLDHQPWQQVSLLDELSCQAFYFILWCWIVFQSKYWFRILVHTVIFVSRVFFLFSFFFFSSQKEKH